MQVLARLHDLAAKGMGLQVVPHQLVGADALTIRRLRNSRKTAAVTRP